nr:unnamed protein product [Naegleria fowleri]
MNNKHPFLVEKEPQKPLISLDLLNSLPQRIVYPVPTKTVPSLSVACFAEDIIICKGLQQSGRWEVFDSEEYFLSNLFTRPLDQEYRYFLDFGSNLGLFSLLLASKGNWKGIAVEALFGSAIEFNLFANKLQDKVRVEKVALASDGIGYVHMKFHANNPGSSTAVGASETEGHMKVPKMTIDMVVKKYEKEGFIPRGVEFDYVKLDIEGFEVKALKGATKLLEQRRVKLWQIELIHHISEAGDDPKDVIRMLNQNGYTVFWGKDKTRKITPETLEIKGWNDAYAFRNDLLSQSQI